MCVKEQKPEPCYEKRELLSRNCTYETQELRSWGHVHEKKSSEVGAVPFSQRLMVSDY